jgi:hypothetical protein
MKKRIIEWCQKFPLWGYILGITIILAVLAFGSSSGDSLTVDESPHIGASYSYIVKGDYRLNPEHPPLLKLLSGVSIWLGAKFTGIPVNFPDTIPAWTEKVNAQWDIGYAFLFKSGNDANTIIWWARLPTILILLLGGVYLTYSVYYHTKSKAISILTLLLYAFSSNVIAHGRLVTTDIIASISFIFAIDIWIGYLKNPIRKYILLLVLALSFGFLSKFSTILLLPLFFITGFGYIGIKYWGTKEFGKQILFFIRNSIIIAIGVFFIINLVYYVAMRNMSIDTQMRLIQESFPQDNQISQITKKSLSEVVNTPGLQYFGQYLLGQSMAIQRVGGGNTTFLLGKFTNQSFTEYFPVTYMLKEHLGILVVLVSLILVSIVLLIRAIQHKNLKLDREWLLKYWYEWTVLMMILLYWIVSIRGNLNLGIRHILPAVILTYIILAIGIVRILVPLRYSKIILSVFLIWYIGSTLLAYPFYISHLNVLAGYNQGYQIFTDSNLDWGQDLKRLHTWTKEQNIDTLYIDYFGTGDVKYYLSDINIIPVKSSDGPKIGYTAISATMFQDSFYLKQKNRDYQEYWWLMGRKPDYIIGNSILIYYNNRY